MKKIIILICVLLVIVVKASYSKEKQQKDVTVLSVKKHTVYFKVKKSFLGGVVEVYSADEKCLEAEELPHTHTMIYFDETPKGVYIIRIKKGDLCTEFKYENN